MEFKKTLSGWSGDIVKCITSAYPVNKLTRYALVLLLLITLTLIGANITEHTYAQNNDFAGGSGTAEDPYMVETAEHLDNVRNYLDARFLQTADIDLGSYLAPGGDGYNDGKGWEPIGDTFNPFIGAFDGNNNKISNLTIDRSDEDNVGLFGWVGCRHNEYRIN